MRACLFNLIVFNKLSPRTDYIRSIVQKVSEKYPCRVLFISHDPDAQIPYLKTAVSVVGEGSIACDYIDIGVAGPDVSRVPFVILPHLIPDLPVSLLWTEDPSKSHPLFDPLVKLARRVIFDSESADSLLAFSGAVLKLRKETKIDTADLNWARTEGWRDLLASLAPEEIQKVQIMYNARATEFFCHLKVQSMYLLAWIASRLNWTFVKASKQLAFTFQGEEGQISSTEWEKLGAGTIIGVTLKTKGGNEYDCARIPTQYHNVSIQIATPTHCELPYRFLLGKTATGQSLVKEIITQGTSDHYLKMLSALKQLDKDRLC
jgi:glucose-6-phosphate dehydrogenase assembly protein OpcA